MEVLKETENVIIYCNDRGFVNFRIKNTDDREIITVEK